MMQYPTTFASVLSSSFFTPFSYLHTLQIAGLRDLQHVRSFAFLHRYASARITPLPCELTPYLVDQLGSVGSQETWAGGEAVGL